MRLEKTDKARAELRAGVRRLGQRERHLLILADGRKTTQDLDGLFNGQAHHLAQALMRDGYLIGIDLGATRSPDARPAPEAAVTTHGGADTFEGKRSLATTRMFLFDLCERLFVRSLPAQAETFREALRQARDREAMLAVAREMTALVETLAGPERAEAINSRIARVLPPVH